MPSLSKINVGGTWKTINNAQINVGGTWKTPSSIKINVGGTWKQVWPNQVQLYNASYTQFNISPTDSYAGYRLTSAGDIHKCEATSATFTDTGLNWLNSGSGYYVRVTVVGDTLTSSSGTGTWLALSTTRTWYYSVTGVSGLLAGTLTVEIADDSVGTNILATASVYLEASVEP